MKMIKYIAIGIGIGAGFQFLLDLAYIFGLKQGQGINEELKNTYFDTGYQLGCLNYSLIGEDALALVNSSDDAEKKVS